MLVETGIKLNNAMWAGCKARYRDDRARDEYGRLLDHFVKYSVEKNDATHVSYVAKRIRTALAAGRPLHGYKVGPDSRATPIVGLLPVPIQDFTSHSLVFLQLPLLLPPMPPPPPPNSPGLQQLLRIFIHSFIRSFEPFWQ